MYTFEEWQDLGMDEDSIVADPLFISAIPTDAAFLVPKTESPAVDAGECTSVFYDYFQTRKPQGEACDIGAVEVL
jgi:hypothetical protein